MIADLLRDQQFQTLAREYKFLARALGETVDQIDAVLFDIETTGLDPVANEITEIGALLIKGSELKDMFCTLIKPQTPISAEITRLTGIDDELVKDAPTISEALPQFLNFVGPLPLIAHNADFDVSFIREQVRKVKGIELPNSIYCTLKLSRKILPGLKNYKLHTIGEHFGLTVANRHRAIGDAELTFQVWQKLLPVMMENNIKSQRELDLLMSQL
jgi:DNA polymerase-3 subunit alpha (Gram-positive type)